MGLDSTMCITPAEARDSLIAALEGEGFMEARSRILRASRMGMWRNAWRMHRAIEQALSMPRGVLRGQSVIIPRPALRWLRTRAARAGDVETAAVFDRALASTSAGAGFIVAYSSS